MHRSIFLAPVLLVINASVLWADARMSVLVDVLKLREAAAILAAEGVDQAQALNEDMLGGQGGAGWALQVEHIYEPSRMVELVRAELQAELAGEALEAVIAFYDSELGTEIVELENAARVAIQDPEVEDAARMRYATLLEEDDERLKLVTELIDSGDMISLNVTSAMNSDVQFYKGLADGDAIEMSEAEILDDVVGGLEEVTEDTTSWLSSYMLLAYHPLSDEELQTYIAFSETGPGQALNRALFAGFGKAFEDISYALGRAVALNSLAEEL